MTARPLLSCAFVLHAEAGAQSGDVASEHGGGADVAECEGPDFHALPSDLSSSDDEKSTKSDLTLQLGSVQCDDPRAWVFESPDAGNSGFGVQTTAMLVVDWIKGLNDSHESITTHPMYHKYLDHVSWAFGHWGARAKEWLGTPEHYNRWLHHLKKADDKACCIRSVTVAFM